ncbi:hypothetical protein [Candidatus Thiothrix anitrata]|uniref:Uncharacterized protein n=1 Tax=Candidatus Thiothrix anitrata TaxID=2823902 RepID=A0ABX7X6Q2_9GAMM|nr:hypothetical protein [Candidatus Thiothrix anitrata]QTR50313.1 hypothetical protein J8380_01635 [Candidatus Thiothrix anitrata]
MNTIRTFQNNGLDAIKNSSEKITNRAKNISFDTLLSEQSHPLKTEQTSLAKMLDTLATNVFGINNAEAGETNNGVLGFDNDGVPSFDDQHPAYHHYVTANSCSKTESWCIHDTAVQGLLRYPAPGASGEPIKDEQTGFATPVGYVRHEVYDNGTKVYNITQEGKHLLDPGIVKRWVSESQDSISINTFGEGTGNMGTLNNWLSDSLWKKVDSNIFDYMRNQSRDK